MDRNMSLGADSIDWADPAFSSTEFQDSMGDDSAWGSSALNDFTNLADYSDSPAGFGFRTPSKAPDATPAATTQSLHLAQQNSLSTETSSQDSSSDSSSRRKRKTTSESPISNPHGDSKVQNMPAMEEESAMDMNNYQGSGAFQQTFTQPMPSLNIDSNMADNNDAMFDFNSAASSPNLPRDFNQQLSLEQKMKIKGPNAAPQFAQESPVQTINPGMFSLGGSRDQSPATNNMMFNAASPNAIFSTPSSDSNDAFNVNQNWNSNMAQNPSWPNDFTNQFTSPGGLGFTPSPVPNGGTPAAIPRAGRSPLHIAPISTKSRVETQINVIMTLEKPPPGTEYLHLPLHTIAKSKLLAKEDYDQSKVLELHTMLVCSSAMHNSTLKEKALHRAATQNNTDIQQRAEQSRDSGDEDRNDMKNVDEADRPANGGEVRICTNCIQRERKRAGRKKLKKEEEQQHWERYETERVVVFNSNEFLPFKPFEQQDQQQKDMGVAVGEVYEPPPGSISVAAAMRIACYCRHQSEKEGFQVIFTLKDQQGNVVAQEMSDSILITDDHKTHPPTLTPVSNDLLFHHGQQFQQQNGLPTSYSLMDLPSHAQPFTSSRSAGNLQALAYGQQFNPHSHVHQLPNNGFVSQATSATMTPTNLSRPGSPNSAGQAGPNKKRKSSTFHKRMPSGLQMTPRDTSQPSSATLPSGTSMGSNFSPSRGGFSQQNDQSYMTIPTNNGPAQYFGSGPNTPATEQNQFQFNNQPHQLDITRAQNASAYFSHPSSAVPSRSNSPILQHTRLNMPGFNRQQPIQTPTNQLTRAQQMYSGQAAPGSAGSENEQPAPPTITKITPQEGPTAGGTEVSIFGYNFTHGTQIMFGDSIAPTTFYGSQSILAISPPGRRGGVRVKLVSGAANVQYASPQSSNPVFTYTDTNPQMMEMALRFLTQQQTGDSGQWVQYTNQIANRFMQTSISPAGIEGQGYGGGGGNMFGAGSFDVEEMVLKILDIANVSESTTQPCYDLGSGSGQTMLSLASASGMHRVAAALLARGANPDARDEGGFTPLMHAALQERPKTFQLLLIKGADSTIRSLKGYVAIDLVPGESRELFISILQNTQRTRSNRPSFHTRHSFGSHGSNGSWDISSASFYESEAVSSDHTISMPTSRRPSTNIAPSPMPEALPESNDQAPSAAMVVWRHALAAQIYHFQQSVHTSMSSFQLPALPPLPDYQDNAMVRRLSLLVPGRSAARAVGQTDDSQPVQQQPRFWDMFYSSPAVSTPPPAYSELFPDKTQLADDEASKKAAVQKAVVDAAADEKCRVLEQPSQKASSSVKLFDGIQPPNKTENTTIPSWLWMPLFVIITSIITHDVVMPYVFTMSTSAFDALQNRSQALLGGADGSCEPVMTESGLNSRLAHCLRRRIGV